MPPRPPALRLRALALSAAGWTLLAAARTLARVAAVPRPAEDAWLLFGRTVLVALPWMVATPFLVALADRVAWRRGSRLRAVGLHLLLVSAWTLAESAWAWTALQWSGQRIPVGPALFLLGRVDQSVFLYVCLLAIGIGLRHRRRLDAALLAAARLEAQLQHARLHVLSLQLHPHFLFNTLNTVSELVHRDAGAARAVLRSLSELLRRSLEPGTTQEITVAEELGLLQPYIRIQHTRFAGSLAITVDAAPAALSAMVPRLVLQPLVENAIRHGTARRAGPGVVAVRVRIEDDRLLIEVEDDGPGPSRRGETADGVGLGNTRARLRELHGDAARLVLLPGAVRGAVARLECPARRRTGHDLSGWREQPAEPPPDAGAEPGRRRLAAGVAAGWMLFAAFGAQEDYLAGHLMGTPDPYAAVWLPRLGEALLWLLLTPAVLWWARRVARAEPGWAALGGAHFAGAAAACAAHAGLTLTLVSPGLEPVLVATVLVTDLSVYAALAAGGHAWMMRGRAAERRAEAARLEGAVAEARLDLLRWRLQPTFLDRALEHIGARAEEDPAGADELTGQLGELLRTLLPPSGGDTVPLGTELEFLRRYLGVAAAIGIAAPSLDATVGPGAARLPVPGMLLLPLAEAVAHGAGRLSVHATLREGGLALAVRGDAPEAGGHPALTELRHRLCRRYGHDCGLDIAATAGGATATLVIPAGAAWREVA